MSIAYIRKFGSLRRNDIFLDRILDKYSVPMYYYIYNM